MTGTSHPDIAIHLASLYGPFGGAERSMLSLAGGLAARGLRVDLVLIDADPRGLEQVPPEVRAVNLRWPRRGFLTLVPIARYLRRERPRAWLSIMASPNLVSLWARALTGARTQVVVQEVTRLSSWLAQHSPARAAALRSLVRLCYPWADAIVVNARGVAEDLARTTGIARARIEVIYTSTVGPELAARAREPVSDPRYAPGGPPLIVSLGRLAPEKDYPTLIRAFAALRQRRDARLVIIGEGAERQALESLVRELRLEHDVSIPGYAANPYALVARARLFVLSSAFEGLPNALIEALACGVPVVSTDCESGPREILEDGAYGRLVPVGDAGSMAAAMLEALDAPFDPERLRARAQQFSFERAVDRYLDILRIR